MPARGGCGFPVGAGLEGEADGAGFDLGGGGWLGHLVGGGGDEPGVADGGGGESGAGGGEVACGGDGGGEGGGGWRLGGGEKGASFEGAGVPAGRARWKVASSGTQMRSQTSQEAVASMSSGVAGATGGVRVTGRRTSPV